MGSFRGWASRLWSRVDRAVAELEDHEALVEAALAELAQAEKGARSELARVRRDGEALRGRMAQEKANAAAWRRTAADEPNDEVALDLLRHARRARARAKHLAERFYEHTVAESRLEEHADHLRERIESMKRQHHLMRTRRAQAEALPSVVGVDDASIEALFERWDMVLTRAEHVKDPFDELSREEEERALRVELRALRHRGEEDG
jgi:phage shock protein A